MFETLSKKLTNVIGKITRRGILSESDVDAALREIRVALLEADVALPVARSFCDKAKEKATGQNIIKSVSAGQMVVKIVYDTLVECFGEKAEGLNDSGKLPHVILMLGLQGSGKTTTTAKLALKLQKEGKHPLMISTDVYRPAARDQLEQLGKQIDVLTLPLQEREVPLDICARGMSFARENNCSHILIDTAGRLHIDVDLMGEIKAISKQTNPCEILLVADAMTGQDAVKSAKAFHESCPITGIILTRVDGDARGGAALSMHDVTGMPIKFMGTGEKLDQLEVFDPARIASRILDMGDIVSFVEKAAQLVEEEEATKFNKRIEKGLFDLNDMLHYLGKMKKMGGFSSIMKMLPGMGNMQTSVDDNMIDRQIAIVYSMTPKERKRPDILDGKRKKRIAAGSGVDVSDINRLLKQFAQVKSMMKQMGMFGGGGGLLQGLHNMLKS